MKRIKVKQMVLAAMFLSIGFILPLLTGQLKEIGDSLLPMHLPVMLCGFICGANYGFLVGLLLPFLRSVVFSMPPIYPNAIWMALELATYGFVVGFLYKNIKTKSVKGIYISLIVAMLLGRIVWGISKAILLGIGGKPFGFALFITGGFVDALPGIILQLILIPLIIKFIEQRREI
jgi:riboflavin transporter FmnP